MPRDGQKVRRHLQEAALRLFSERGYEQTTAAEIAAEAGVTERTFFRHFRDKREVLFDGEDTLKAVLIDSINGAPRELGPWSVLLTAFQVAEPLFIANRRFSEPRRRVVNASPALQEREFAKIMSLNQTLASALRERKVPDREAALLAQMGVAALGQAFGAWLDGEPGELRDHLAHFFRVAHDCSGR